MRELTEIFNNRNILSEIMRFLLPLDLNYYYYYEYLSNLRSRR